MSIQLPGGPPPSILSKGQRIKKATTTKLFGKKVTSPQQGLQSRSTPMKPLGQNAPLSTRKNTSMQPLKSLQQDAPLPTRESTSMQPHNPNSKDLLPEGTKFDPSNGEFEKTVALSSKEVKKIEESVASEVAGKSTKTTSNLLSLAGKGILHKVYQSMLSEKVFHNPGGYSQMPYFVDGRSQESVVFQKKEDDYQITGRVTKLFSVIPGAPGGHDLQVEEGKMTIEVSVIADGNALKSGEVKLHMARPPRALLSGNLLTQE